MILIDMVLVLTLYQFHWYIVCIWGKCSKCKTKSLSVNSLHLILMFIILIFNLQRHSLLICHFKKREIKFTFGGKPTKDIGGKEI